MGALLNYRHADSAQDIARTSPPLPGHHSQVPLVIDRGIVQVKAWPDALRIALRLDSREKVEAVLGECGKDSGPDSLQERQQLAYILASQVAPSASCL